LGPVPPPEYWIEDGFLSNLEYLLPRHGQTHFLMFPLNTIFADALDLFGGFQEGLIALHTKRALFHKALEAIVEWKISRLRAGAALHAPGAWMIEYTAGADTISPRAYREFVFPYEQRVIQEAHRLGMLVYLWYLGHVTPLAADIGRLGVDALFPEQGRKGYPVDIVELRRLLGDQICLIGFNNEQDMIQGNREALSSEIERQIQGAGRNGAFIMGTTIVTEEVLPETMDYYIETVQRLGQYGPV
jgi:uroporphyrinogen-III decarboxylase